jgi:hypothetical protein
MKQKIGQNNDATNTFQLQVLSVTFKITTIYKQKILKVKIKRSSYEWLGLLDSKKGSAN